jgi:hypothetical protein
MTAFMCGWTPPPRWPVPSSVERSRPSPGATGTPILLRGGRRPDRRGEQIVCERWWQKGQLTQTCDCHQRAQDSRQKGRPEDEVPDQEAIESEKYQADVDQGVRPLMRVGILARLRRQSDSNEQFCSRWSYSAFLPPSPALPRYAGLLPPS